MDPFHAFIDCCINFFQAWAIIKRYRKIVKKSLISTTICLVTAHEVISARRYIVLSINLRHGITITRTPDEWMPCCANFYFPRLMDTWMSRSIKLSPRLKKTRNLDSRVNFPRLTKPFRPNKPANCTTYIQLTNCAIYTSRSVEVCIPDFVLLIKLRKLNNQQPSTNHQGNDTRTWTTHKICISQKTISSPPLTPSEGTYLIPTSSPSDSVIFLMANW